MYPGGGRKLARTGMRNKLFSLHGLIKKFGIIIEPEELEKAINDSDKILWRMRLNQG